MPHLTTRLFTQADQDRIAAAVSLAEKKTSGEIVPFAAEQSDRYEEAEWRCGVLLGSVAFALFVAIRRFTSLWVPLDIVEIVASSLLAGGVGILLVKWLPAVKRFFAGDALMEHRVRQRAAEAFIAEEVFNTRERTGILIFISALERKVLVVGDAGITRKVKQEEWDAVVRAITDGIRAGKAGQGLIEAIGACGRLLERRGVTVRPDDTDELPDSLRLSDR